MSTTHVAWSSIELLHNVVRALQHLRELGHPFPVVEYRAKVKLHGSNYGVQIIDDGIAAQSRTSLLTPEADYKGFAAWVHRHETLAQLMFKAKGEKHRTAGTKAAVAVDAATVASVDEFVALMVTEARLAQGLAAVAQDAGDRPRDPKLTGKFLEWIVADVRKESTAELEASGLLFAQVEKAIRVRARTWYLGDTSS